MDDDLVASTNLEHQFRLRNEQTGFVPELKKATFIQGEACQARTGTLGRWGWDSNSVKKKQRTSGNRKLLASN